MIRNNIKHAVFGLDLGQSQDPSALTLVLHNEQTISPHNWIDATHPTCRYFQLTAARTFPLGTAYTAVAREVHQSIRQIKQAWPHVPVTLIADATGLGRPTLEILYQELTSRPGHPPARLEGLVFTASGDYTRATHPSLPVDLFHVPKLDLIQTLVQAMDSRQLIAVPDLPEQATLAAQLQSLRYSHRRDTGRTSIYVAPNPSNPAVANADLVMALAMATWRLKSLFPNLQTNIPVRLPGF